MKKAQSKSPFSAIVFAGGGDRCMWQAGFLTTAAPALGLRPDEVSGASAGSAIACLVFAERTHDGIEFFKEITARNKRNFYPGNIFRGKPAFPHYEIYRKVILNGIDAASLKKLHSGPDIRILMTHPPAWCGPRLGTFIGLSSYVLEKHIAHTVHPVLSSKIGFRGEVVSVRDCTTPGELASVILASSCTPPFMPLQYRNSKPVLDGGLIDNVPVSALARKHDSTLILLTRQYPRTHIPNVPGRTYVMPSIPVPISKWDYTNPKGIQLTFEIGLRDGERFARSYTKNLSL